MINGYKLPEGVAFDYTSDYAQEIQNSVNMVAADYAAAAERANLNPDDVYEMVQRQHTDREVAVGTIDDVPFVSTRVCVGAEGAGAYRGGLERGGRPGKVGTKGAVMYGKQTIAGTGDQGGKGGLWIPPEYEEFADDDWWLKAVGVHALIHHINGHTNPTATDIGTFPPHMNAIVDTLLPYQGKEAYAAVSGADETHGGNPDFQLRTTGEGASIHTHEYLLARAKASLPGDELAHRINRGDTLRILQQAFGKAGAPFALRLPAGTTLAGGMEYAGGLYSTVGTLDPVETVRLARQNGLAQDSKAEGQEWLSPKDLKKFWRRDADILVAAFDANQIDADDIEDTPAEVVIPIANRGVTRRGIERAHELGVDVLNDAATNMGGTLGSSKRGNMLLHKTYANEAELERSWNNDMRRISRGLFEEMFRLRRQGANVSPEDVVFRVIAQRIVEHRRQLAVSR